MEARVLVASYLIYEVRVRFRAHGTWKEGCYLLKINEMMFKERSWKMNGKRRSTYEQTW